VTITLGRPLAATLLLAGLLSATILGVVASSAGLWSATDERDAKAELLAHSVAASRRAKLTNADAPEADPFVVADTETLGAARLDALVRTTAMEAGCALLSSRAEVKPDEGEIAGRIEVQAVIEGQNDALQAALLRLETGAPTVLVDELSIEPAQVVESVVGSPQAPRLHMSLTASAFWRSPRSGQEPQGRSAP
jgi:hypothetical protein